MPIAVGDGRRRDLRRPAPVTGWSVATAACSATATRASTARPAAMRSSQPVNGIAPTKTGNGYWFVAWDGGVFGFGDARFYGSTGNRRLNAPVDGMAATPTRQGLLARRVRRRHLRLRRRALLRLDGQHPPCARRSSAWRRSPSGKGYWLVASDGGVFGFGDAHFLGSAASTPRRRRSSESSRRAHGQGYWIELADGVVMPLRRCDDRDRHALTIGSRRGPCSK